MKVGILLVSIQGPQYSKAKSGYFKNSGAKASKRIGKGKHAHTLDGLAVQGDLDLY